MPVPRKPENRGLPSRWRHYHGAYYYEVPPGMELHWDGKKKFRLGKTLPESYRVWAERLGTLDKAKTVGQLLDRYALEVVPTKAPTTQTQNQLAVKQLREKFHDAPLGGIKPRHIYAYVNLRRKKVKQPDGSIKEIPAVTAAHREIEVLSHAFTKAVEWGYLDRHPFKFEVRLKGEDARTRYVEDWEVDACMSIKPKRPRGGIRMVQAYIRLKGITGMARGDLLRLQPESHFTDDGILIERNKTAKKTGKRTLYQWTEELRRCVREAIDARSAQNSTHLFCNRRAEPYINELTGRAGGWDSLWRDFMDRVLEETDVSERFSEHDLRAKAASDAETLEHAQALLSHTDSRTTRRVYRRKAEKVMPLK